jgi:uncharacterized protein (TIGR02246 family)
MPSDEDQIRAVLSRYCHFCDEGRFEEWAELFTEDGTFTVMGQTRQGHAELRAFMEAALPRERRGRHMLSLPLIEVDGDEARGWTDFAFVGRSDEGLAVTQAGRYHDRFVRQDGAWRFASHEIVFMGDEPGNRPPDV